MGYILNMRKRIYHNDREGGFAYEAILEKKMILPDLPQYNLSIIIAKNDYFIIEGLALDFPSREYHANQSIRMPHYHRDKVTESVAIHIANGWTLTGESSAGE